MLSVTFLGTSAARPTVERNVTAIVVVREGETLLFDCGEGTQRQMMRYGVSFTLSDIFVTHFHADHFLGIAGLLRTLGLQGRTDPMRLFGPRGAKRVLGEVLELGVERSPVPVEIVELKVGDRVERTHYDVATFATEHGRTSIGFALVEHARLGRFDPDKARALGIPEGPLWGRVHKGETVTLPDGRRVEPAELEAFAVELDLDDDEVEELTTELERIGLEIGAQQALDPGAAPLAGVRRHTGSAVASSAS